MQRFCSFFSSRVWGKGFFNCKDHSKCFLSIFLAGWSRNPRYISWSFCRWKGSLVRRSVCGSSSCAYCQELMDILKMNNSDKLIRLWFHLLDVPSLDSSQKWVLRDTFLGKLQSFPGTHNVLTSWIWYYVSTVRLENFSSIDFSDQPLNVLWA